MMQDKVFIVVDMLYDFIDGSMACANAENAVLKTIEYLNNNGNKVFYVCDSHPTEHSSFKDFGGIWPSHCVKGSHGAEIHQNFYKLKNNSQKPGEENIYRKGEDKALEQYSGYKAKNLKGYELGQMLKDKDIIISGIATEYCVFETIKELLNANCQISVLEEGLAYVDYKGHIETINKIKEMGVALV